MDFETKKAILSSQRVLWGIVFLTLFLLGVGFLRGNYELLFYGSFFLTPIFLLTLCDLLVHLSWKPSQKKEVVINADPDAKCDACGSILGKGVTRCWHCDRVLERDFPSYQPHEHQILPREKLLEPKIINSSQELRNLNKFYGQVFGRTS